MSSTKRKKVVKYRGSKTHGGGSMKKRRGAGHRGGRGNAGSGKRGDSRKPSYWGKPGFGVGKHGFTTKSRTVVVSMNVSEVEREMDRLVKQGAASGKPGAYTVDLEKARVDKLLGSGQVTQKLTITVKHASPKAIEKVEAAGGSVKLTAERKQKKQKGKAPAKDSSDEGSEDSDE